MPEGIGSSADDDFLAREREAKVGLTGTGLLPPPGSPRPLALSVSSSAVGPTAGLPGASLPLPSPPRRRPPSLVLDLRPMEAEMRPVLEQLKDGVGGTTLVASSPSVRAPRPWGHAECMLIAGALPRLRGRCLGHGGF